jgi:hypothetical protein
MSNKFTEVEIEQFIKIVFEIIDNNRNESKNTKIDLIKKEVERRVKQ